MWKDNLVFYKSKSYVHKKPSTHLFDQIYFDRPYQLKPSMGSIDT